MPNLHQSDVDIVIPNFNGRDLLDRCLFLLDAEHVIVVDDASTDGSLEMLREKHPKVKVIARKENGGFSAAANDGIRAAQSDLVLLLNNDVEVAPGFLEPIVPMFADESVFAVCPRTILPTRGNLDEGAKTGFWHHGLLYTDQRQGVKETIPILYPNGCAAVCRRSMLESLGGFDEAYSPFYWEDVDLGYRAWKRGWKSLYQPLSTVHHQHSASISRIDAKRTETIKARNSLLFIWRNIEDEGLMRSHVRWLPLVLAKRAVSGDRAFVSGWREASGMRQDADRARENDSAHRVLSDREILRAAGVES